MNKKKTERAMAGSHAVTVGPVRYTMAELLAGAEASGAYTRCRPGSMLHQQAENGPMIRSKRRPLA